MHPAETDRAKKSYKGAFLVCGLAICVLIGVQTYRNGVAQQNLIAELKAVELKALMPSVTSVAPPINNAPPKKEDHLTPKIPIPRIPVQKLPERPAAPSINQSSQGSCSPNIVGDNNSTNCAPEPKLTATSQLQQRTSNGEWVTTFTVSSNLLIQTGDLRLLCDGPVLRAGISRMNPASFSSGNNGPNPLNPNEALYQLGPEMLSPGAVVVIAVYSTSPVHVLSGSLGNQVITLAK